MDTSNWVTILNSTLKNLLTGNSSQFLSFGLAIERGLAIILLVRYGITTALRGRGFDWGDFFNEVILLVGACFCMVQGYSTPMAIFGGETFPFVVMDGPSRMADDISRTSQAQMEAVFHDVLTQNPNSNNFMDIGGQIEYWIMRGLIETTRAVMFAITAFGLVAEAVIILVGPVFIPFLLFQPMAFMFWGWFRLLLQYSFYPLICACFSSVLTTFFVNLPMSKVSGALTTQQVIACSPFFLVIILGMLSVPAIVNGLFSGNATAGPISRYLS